MYEYKFMIRYRRWNGFSTHSQQQKFFRFYSSTYKFIVLFICIKYAVLFLNTVYTFIECIRHCNIAYHRRRSSSRHRHHHHYYDHKHTRKYLMRAHRLSWAIIWLLLVFYTSFSLSFGCTCVCAHNENPNKQWDSRMRNNANK